MTVDQIIGEIDRLTVGDYRRLTLRLQEKFDVKPTTQSIPQIIGVPADEAEEQFEFDVVLTAVDAERKVTTIKAVREVTNLGLRESKAVVDELPSTIVTAVTKEVADRVRAALTATGATVEVR